MHETGLFQGKLGFRKAIVLLEEGLTPFSNIAGLSHVPFPKGNFKEAEAVKNLVRGALEREGLVRSR